MSPEVAERVPTLAKSLYPDRTPEIVFHPQCFASHGHFAGDDERRGQAFLDIANDESYDAVWFARGGYGSCRMVEAVMCRLTEPSRRKTYVGYSDAGVLLAALYRAGFENVAHGPVAQDILRDGGEKAVGRSLAWMVDLSPEALESTAGRGKMTAAFNMTVLSQLLGTPLQPDLGGHVLMLEEVGEAMYRIDRSLFHITSNAEIRRVSGVMLGRCSNITPNEPNFGMNEEEIARYWGFPGWDALTLGMTSAIRLFPSGRAASHVDRIIRSEKSDLPTTDSCSAANSIVIRLSHGPMQPGELAMPGNPIERTASVNAAVREHETDLLPRRHNGRYRGGDDTDGGALPADAKRRLQFFQTSRRCFRASSVCPSRASAATRNI
jgi:muramoyltetrapeptide carboxypeptidase